MEEILPVATLPITLLAKLPPLFSEERNAAPPRPPPPESVAFLAAPFEKLRLTTPASPPLANPEELPPEDEPPEVPPLP